MNSTYTFQSGNTPLLINVPHAGVVVPNHISDTFSNIAKGLPDTDWFVDKLYGWVVDLGASLMTATHSRYVIDLNRPPDDAALYEKAGTHLVPQTTFFDQPIYEQGVSLRAEEIERRRQTYWQPYHDKLALEMNRIRQKFGFAILIDAHSILSHVPMLFDGQLPDLNLGSNRGKSAAQSLISLSTQALSSSQKFSFVLDGRFQGGHITRYYGQPQQGWHALQLEMAQCVYMREHPPEYDLERAMKVRPVLQLWIERLMKWTPDHEC